MKFNAVLTVAVPVEDIAVLDEAVYEELMFNDYEARCVNGECTATYRGSTDLDEMPWIWAKNVAQHLWRHVGHFLSVAVLISSPSGKTLRYVFDDEGEYEAMKIEEVRALHRDLCPELEPQIIDRANWGKETFLEIFKDLFALDIKEKTSNKVFECEIRELLEEPRKKEHK